MKKVELLETQKHPKGDIPKGAIFEWNEDNSRYEYRYTKKGPVVSSVNEPAVEAWPHLFKRL